MLISTTLAHNSEAIIGDALRSVVDWVDCCLIIDTGITDQTLKIAKEVVGQKLMVTSFKFNGNFSDARNFALEAAAQLEASWAVTLDTDERLHFGDRTPASLQKELAETPEACLYVSEAQNTYVKERFFKIPMSERWEGPTHESFAAYKVGCKTLEGVTFSELPKSLADNERKFRRDVGALIPYIELHPKDARWPFYLGESHRNLGEFEAAVRAYDTCSALKGWDEESAWACFRAAECLYALNRQEEALDRLGVGITRHAGLAELYWFAGYISYQLGRDSQAVYWSEQAIAYGLFQGKGASVPRIGFRDPVGLWEGPYDVLRWAEKRRGNLSAASRADEMWVLAQQARTKSQRTG